ncbi:HAD-IIB family hydrolase [Cytobacillus oceanisediminis]|uniref:Haloacid dehalogenase n=1 Tax=Cytobacillus oceanisediminis TaxID=665099 RepID=A0ABX3CTR6_9BACI|nr:HAD-IIB family hydrolase [Cytobacillus oceanisediminis]OHX48530.1 haloacid dehalogenase [Cytobacillus oceanisediminis]
MTFKVYHSNGNPDYLMIFDFDETYYPHELKGWQLKDLYELEEYLDRIVHKKNIRIGWVTGSSLADIHKKMRAARMNYLPHFIASNLGTELWEINSKGEFYQNQEWSKRIKRSGFSHRVVEDLINDLRQLYGIQLQKQTQFGQQSFKMNYYYFIEDSARVKYDLDIIKQLARNSGINFNINRCNPLAGDPVNAFDVDFIPQNTGKRAVVYFVIKQFSISVENTFAFGDSGNDIEMLKAVRHGYLLKNATEEAKQLHDTITADPYAKGIQNVCRIYF